MDGMSKNKKTPIIITSIILIIVVAIVLVFVLRPKEETPTITGDGDITSDVVEEGSTEESKPSDSDTIKTETGYLISVTDNKVNAYDYILEIMNQPQFWSEEEFFPLYSFPWDEEPAKEALVNGTGWRLVDEEKAIFERGYKGKLTINFSEHIAISREELADITYYLDFKNDIYKRNDAGYERDINFKRGTEIYWNNVYGIIENTFLYYEEIFAAAGCPLLEMPEGTLAKYKNKNAKEVTLLDDGLIHNPWSQEGWSFNWENDKNINWLTDYRDILNVEVPESETVPWTFEDLDGIVTEYQMGIYSPVYLVMANKNSSIRYQDGSILFDSIDCTQNAIEAFATYYLNPVMEELYGHPAVYFVDKNELPGPNYAGLLFKNEEFEQGIQYNNESYAGILEIYPIGNKTTRVVYSYYPNHYDILNLKDEVKKAYEYHGNNNYKYADDYIGNFMLVYSLDEQRILGLR